MKTRKINNKGYKPQTPESRFWIYSEQCYTESELQFRKNILAARSQSGLDPEYLSNPNTWFAEDEIALINVYENSWFFSNAYTPRQVLTSRDFYIPPLDSQYLQWPSLYQLMQEIGDYLVDRNTLLRSEHLNAPMNFVLLDINQILKKLSQTPNIHQVKEQLELLPQYIRSIETEISPIKNSDRLFLVNFRTTLNKRIKPELEHLVASQLLRDKLEDLSKMTKMLSIERNRILHFVLNGEKLNPHSYDFSMESVEHLAAFPTQAAKKCGQTSGEVSTTINLIPSIKLDAKQLKQCAQFKLITEDEETLDHYAKAIQDLNELERFQKIINQVKELLGQAGEAYTVYQFNHQLLDLLKHMDVFMEESTQHIEAILEANTYFYHEAIQKEQKLSLWEKVMTSEQQKLQSYIKNQDTLEQFSSKTTSLLKTTNQLKDFISKIVTYLTKIGLQNNSFELINSKTQSLDKLMNSMQNWIEINYKEQDSRMSLTTEIRESFVIPSPPEITIYQPLFLPSSRTQYSSEINAQTNTAGLLTYLGILSIIPLGIILLLLFYSWKNSNSNSDKKEDEDSITEDLCPAIGCG